MLSKSTIKFIVSLQQKKNRDEQKLFVAEGPKVVPELLKEKLFVCRHLFATSAGLSLLQNDADIPANLQPELIKDEELQKISSLKNAHQLLAVFQQKTPEAQPNFNHKISLVLDDIQDPGNLGTLIRIADWFNIKYLICSLHTADVYNSKVVQSSMASLGRVQVLYKNLAEWLPTVKQPKLATSLQGAPLQEINNFTEGFLLIGNEGNGLSKELMDLCEQQVFIPRLGKAESLNAAVATGILLQNFCKA